MSTCEICGTDDSSQIMRIFNIIKKNDKRRLSLIFCFFQDIFHCRIIISRNLCDHTLMCTCLAHGIQSFLWNKFYNGIMFSGFSCDGADRSVLTAIQNKQFINTFTGTKCLKDRISSFYHFSQFKFPPSQVLHGPVPVSLKNPLSGKDIPSAPQTLWHAGNPPWWHVWPW